ncbi:MAG: response regulator [Gemmatimonadota bacterium]|nr:response regulator [Gemmatimonadota bacterium]
MKKRILMVDDESAILFAYKKILQHPDIVIDAVESREEALSLLQKNSYQAVILDLRLHGSNGEEGFELINTIRDKYCQSKIIMITAYGTPEIKAKAYRLGADYYFEKPISTRIIQNALEDSGIPTLPVHNGHEQNLRRSADGG